MPYLSPALTLLVAAVKKAGQSLTHDFNEVEKLQASVRGSEDFAKAAVTRAERILRQELFALGEDLGNFEVEYIKNPYGFFQNHTQADIGPTTNDLGYKPAFDLESGIKAYMPEIYAIFQRRQNVAFA